MRREEMMQRLSQSVEPIKGNILAEQFNVTRQVVVKDIALLRAQGHPIIATPQGYILLNGKGSDTLKRVIPCLHDMGRMEEELLIIVEAGARVNDVIVEHPIYGEIQGNLRLSSVNDVRAYIEHIEKVGAKPLSLLTEGIHLHTIEAENEEVLEAVESRLRENGLLVVKDV